MGFKRNQNFILLQDYTTIPKTGFINLLENATGLQKEKLVLIGDFWLCMRFYQIIRQRSTLVKRYDKIVYCDLLKMYETDGKIELIEEDGICDGDICLLLLPEYYGCFMNSRQKKVGLQKYISELYMDKIRKLKERNIINFSMFPYDVIDMDYSKNTNAKDKAELKIGKIIIGAINSCSGNVFFKGLLDNHPDILMIEDSYLNTNLYFICMRLAVESSDNILVLFWKIYREESAYFKGEGQDITNIEKFNQSMKKMLILKHSFLSQELFVMIHIAYAEMYGRNIKSLCDMIIYWEPHYVDRNKVEDYALWLSKVSETRYIINIVRNAYIRAGSLLRNTVDNDRRKALKRVLNFPNKEKKNYEGWIRVVVRFEDLKCDPVNEMQTICGRLGIEWSDTLMYTTQHGKISSYEDVTGFDLKPVYKNYEEYFTEFDRFRISLIVGPWQKKYGYPYVSSLDYSRKELHQMFQKEFRFEERFKYKDDKEMILVKNQIQWIINEYLWEIRRMEIMELKRLSDMQND